MTLVDDGRLITYFRDDVRGGSVDVNLKIPGGVALTKFEAHLPRHFRKYKGKRRAYLRTPPTCPAERRLDHEGDLHLPGRLDAAAAVDHALQGE